MRFLSNPDSGGWYVSIHLSQEPNALWEWRSESNSFFKAHQTESVQEVKDLQKYSSMFPWSTEAGMEILSKLCKKCQGQEVRA